MAKRNKTVELKAKKSTRGMKAAKSSRGTKAVKSSRSMKAAKSSRKTKAVSGRSKAAAGGTVVLLCRDCDCDFQLDVSGAQGLDTLTCPVCEHRAQPPSNDIIHQISLYKGIEHKNLTLAIAAAVVAFISMVFWSIQTSGQATPEPALFYGPIGVAVIGLLMTLVFGAKYERSRWVTFF